MVEAVINLCKWYHVKGQGLITPYQIIRSVRPDPFYKQNFKLEILTKVMDMGIENSIFYWKNPWAGSPRTIFLWPKTTAPITAIYGYGLTMDHDG